MFSRLMSIAEETLAEFLSKATGTAVEWVQMPGMKVATLFDATIQCLETSFYCSFYHFVLNIMFSLP